MGGRGRSCHSSSQATTVTTVLEGEAEQEVAGLQFLGERDMRSLHRHIPALGRSDVRAATIRQHYYPEGGWGWVVVSCACLAQALTTGLVLAGGRLGLELLYHCPGTDTQQATWVVATAWAACLGRMLT